MDGHATEGRDIFLLKINSAGTLVWKKHFHSNLTGIGSASGNDFGTSMIWDAKDDAIYFIGDTFSSMAETNSSASYDILFAKVKSDGTLSWIKQYGEETKAALIASTGNAALTTAQADRGASIQMSPNRELIMTFQTDGSLFETSAGLTDIGIMKVKPSNGDIIKGVQLGSQTLAAWATANTISVNGNKEETLIEGNFAFDGNLIVVPFRTKSALVETNPTFIADGAHVIFNYDLSINSLKQLGPQTYAAWVAAGNYSGSIAADNQYRSVVVNGPGDYLFFGKSNGNLTEVAQGSDYFFARYINGDLESLIQYGSTTLPTGTGSEQARAMMKDASGNIYCMGHSNASIFEGLQGAINPMVFRVDENGALQEGVQFGSTQATDMNITMNYALIQAYGFVLKHGKILVGVNNDPVASGTNYNPFLWNVTMP